MSLVLSVHCLPCFVAYLTFLAYLNLPLLTLLILLCLRGRRHGNPCYQRAHLFAKLLSDGCSLLCKKTAARDGQAVPRWVTVHYPCLVLCCSLAVLGGAWRLVLGG